MNIKPLGKVSDIIMQEMQDECLLYNLQTNKAVSLNQSAYFVWQNCSGVSDVKEITRNFNQKFNVKVEEDYIFLTLSELEKANLLEGELSFSHNKISRRKAILKYGMMAVMLPVAISVIAPQAIHAASGCVTCSGVDTSTCPTTFSNDPRCTDPGCICFFVCNSGCCQETFACE